MLLSPLICLILALFLPYSCLIPALFIFFLQSPDRPSPKPFRLYEAQFFEMNKVFPERSFGRGIIDALADFSKCKMFRSGQYMQNLSLSISQILRHPMGGYIAARQEPHPNAAGLFAEFGFRMSGLDAQFHNLLRAAPPALDHAAQVENLGD